MEIIKRIALSQVPRILGFGDRDKESETFGCFDRYYWHYKLHDFPNIRFQEAALLLSLLYNYKFPENIYYKNKNLNSWITAIIGFWTKCKHRNGSFDEVYPNEQSFCTTSFSTFAISESCLLMGDYKKYEKVFCKIGKWIAKNNNIEVANQMAAAMVALQNIYIITGDEYFREESLNKLERLLTLQDEKGRFYEYGWGDLGYQTITLSCLSDYYEKMQDEKVKLSIETGINWLKKYVKEDGSYDVVDMSRKTQYIYLYSLINRADDIVEKVKKGLEADKILNPSWMDDRYLIPMTIDYLKSYIKGQKNVNVTI